MTAVTVHRVLEPKKIKPVIGPTFSPSVCHEVMGPDAMIFVGFWVSKQLFHSPLSPSSGGPLVLLCFVSGKMVNTNINNKSVGWNSLRSTEEIQRKSCGSLRYTERLLIATGKEGRLLYSVRWDCCSRDWVVGCPWQSSGGDFAFHCKGWGFDPSSESWDPHASQP